MEKEGGGGAIMLCVMVRENVSNKGGIWPDT